MLRASMMISSPVAVIKELVENSVDSGATLVQVEVDSTTLAHVQVQDNGPGISPGVDRELFAVPNTTSKIVKFEDIFEDDQQNNNNKKGKLLGFRGEALAAIADLAESPPNIKMKVTTRTVKESVGQCWLVDRNGKAILPGVSVAAPKGTTMTLSGLFARYPVRRKILLKESTKNLVKIRHLLLAYSILYPNVRLNLRVRGSASKSGPVKPLLFKETSTNKEKLAQVFGATKVSNLCEGSKKVGSWSWTYVLPKQMQPVQLRTIEGDDAKIIWDYSLIGVNGRPLTSTLPVTKKITFHINKRLSACLNGQVEKQRSAIWVLGISSVSNTDFDVNIEPSKDDLIFTDMNQLLNNIDAFLETCYCNMMPVNSSLAKPEIPHKMPPSSPPSVQSFKPLTPKYSPISSFFSSSPGPQPQASWKFSCPPTPSFTSSSFSVPSSPSTISSRIGDSPSFKSNHASPLAKPNWPRPTKGKALTTLNGSKPSFQRTIQHSPSPSETKRSYRNPRPLLFAKISCFASPKPRENKVVSINLTTLRSVRQPSSIPIAEYLCNLLEAPRFGITTEGWIFLS